MIAQERNRLVKRIAEAVRSFPALEIEGDPLGGCYEPDLSEVASMVEEDFTVEEVPLLRETQTIPPARHLRKAKARLAMLNGMMRPAMIGATKKERAAAEMNLARYQEYAHQLEIVLHDYERMLDGLLPDREEAEVDCG